MGGEPWIRLLGPVSVGGARDGRPLAGRPQQIVLACLALDADRVVTAATLIDTLWPDAPPANAVGNLHSYVSKLRRVVGGDRLLRTGGGYRLCVHPDEVDLGVVDALVETARHRTGSERADLLEQALAMWRGDPLAGLADVPALVPAVTRWTSRFHELTVQCWEATVDAGRPQAVVADLRAAAQMDPHDEVVTALLARALHATGRTAEALRVLSSFQRRMVQETGLPPGPTIVELERRLLTDGPSRADGSAHAPGADRAQVVAATDALPTFATPLVGRDDDVEALDTETRAGRVVTLTGTGGVGKTRVACALAERRRAAGQSVSYLALTELSRDDDVATRLAAALGLRLPQGRDPALAVADRIGGGGRLLVVDNGEHLLDSLVRLVEVLAARPSDLTVLITSRVPLGLSAERVIRLAPLDPSTDAVHTLFVNRARRASPGFDPAGANEAGIRAVNRHLGGLPLAIELAAGRMAALAPADLAERIDDIGLLTGGGSGRHHTLRAAIDWSYQLLPPHQRRLFRLLGAFPGGVELETVEALADRLELGERAAASVAALADASLVEVDLSGPTRYTMLEPLRSRAVEMLAEAGETESVRAVRADWARDAVHQIAAVARGPDEAVADARLRRELSNLRAVHRHALRHDDLDTAIAISAALIRPANARDLPEIFTWAADLADHPQLRAHPQRAAALGAAASAAWLSGDLERGARLATEGLAHDADSVECLQALASVELLRGNPATARRRWAAANRPDGAYLPMVALAAVYEGDEDLARSCLDEADESAARLGSPSERALCLYARAEWRAPSVEAIDGYEAAIEAARTVGATFVASISRVGLASVLASNGRHLGAIDEFVTVIRYWRTTGNWIQQWITLRNVVTLLEQLGRVEPAATIHAVADVAQQAGAPSPRGGDAADVGADTGSATPDDTVVLALAELAEARRDHPA